MSDLTYLGKDDWSRSLFRTENGLILVDVDGQLYTITDDWGEPCTPTRIPTPKRGEKNEAKY